MAGKLRDHREKIKEIEPQIAQINTDFVNRKGQPGRRTRRSPFSSRRAGTVKVCSLSAGK